jgi:hypothetical protein
VESIKVHNAMALAERAFSAVGIFITKLRKLSPSTIDALIFLKYYFKNRGVLRDT